jgi:hypothetical protein
MTLLEGDGIVVTPISGVAKPDQFWLTGIQALAGASSTLIVVFSGCGPIEEHNQFAIF